LDANLTFSLVTPSLNQGQFIERAIQSVLSQNYPRLEYLVIGGGSTDGTLAFLRRHQGRLTWLSEADQGQAQAINKGFQRASGDIIGWLNADDELMPNALNIIADYFAQHPDAKFVYGNALTIDENGRVYGCRGNVKPTNFEELLTQGDFIVQPAAFWRLELLYEVGYLDESLEYCLDYEYWLRIAQKYPLHYLPVPLAKERFHAQAKTPTGGLKRIQEIEAVARRYGNPDIPARFRTERAAVYCAEMLRRVRHRNWSEVGCFYEKMATGLTLSLFVPFLPHLVANLLLGPKNRARMRLLYDLVRSNYNT
jgi:glycosyltransferase involved in cell wall biosynthesis